MNCVICLRDIFVLIHRVQLKAVRMTGEKIVMFHFEEIFAVYIMHLGYKRSRLH